MGSEKNSRPMMLVGVCILIVGLALAVAPFAIDFWNWMTLDGGPVTEGEVFRLPPFTGAIGLLLTFAGIAVLVVRAVKGRGGPENE